MKPHTLIGADASNGDFRIDFNPFLLEIVVLVYTNFAELDSQAMRRAAAAYSSDYASEAGDDVCGGFNVARPAS